MNIKKVSFSAFMSCLSFILSTFVSFPFVVPFQHFFNVICAVLVGPFYGFLSALLTGCMRMLLTGRPVTAIIGAVVGAFLAGIGYRISQNMLLAVAGEILGTGILSAIVSYYAMYYGFGVALLGYAALLTMKRSGSLVKLQEMLK